MDVVRRVIGAYLIIIAAIVGIFSVVEPWFHASTAASPYSPAWEFINPFTGIGCVLGAAFAFIRKRALDAVSGDAVTWTRLAASAQFYGIMAVALLYLWNWFFTLNIDSYTPVDLGVFGLSWKPTDVAFPLIAGSIGIGMWKGRATD